MKLTTVGRRVMVVACVAAAVAGVDAGAAWAGGDGQVYIYGDTLSQCNANLSSSIKLYRANDYVVTGVHGCRKTGDGKRYFGDFVANPV